MYRNVGLRLFASLLTAAGMAVVGFIVYFMVSIYGGMIFYAPLSGVFIAGGTLLLIARIMGFWEPPTLRKLFLGFTALCVLAGAGYWAREAYIARYMEVREDEVYLAEYAPYAQDTKAAKLEAPSTLRLADHLPRLDGATALYPLYAAFAQAVYPEGEYQTYALDSLVRCTTTPDAISSLIRGERDIVFTAAPSAGQLKEAERAGVKLVLTPIGREAFVFFVNKHNPVSSLTSSQIRDIYSGKVTRWQELGGSDHRIRAFQRPEGSGSQSMLQKVMGDTPLMTPPQEDVADMMSGIISRTASYLNYKNAIGYSFLFYATGLNRSGGIKLLAIDGVQPSREHIADGTYPFSAEFYAITAGERSGNVKAFVDWMLTPQGQELVEKTGFTPVE